MSDTTSALKEENRILREQLRRALAEVADAQSASATGADAIPSVPGIDYGRRARILDAKSAYYVELLRDSCEALENLPSPWAQLGAFYKRKKATSYAANNFKKAIAVFKKGGAAKLEKELSLNGADGQQIANILTGVAKKIRDEDPAGAYELARRAWAAHPKQFRMKWLAFQAGKAGKKEEAVFIFDMLGDIGYTASEKKIADRYRKEVADAENLEASTDAAKTSDFIWTPVATKAQASGDPAEILKEINENLKTFVASHTKEVTYLLDCMDEQKEVIRDCANEAFINAIGKIRELQAEEGGRSGAEKDRERLVAELSKDGEPGDNFASGELAKMPAGSLEFLLAFQKAVKQEEYDVIIEIGEFLAARAAGFAKKGARFISASPNAENFQKNAGGGKTPDGVEIAPLRYKGFPSGENGEALFYDCSELFASIPHDKKVLIAADKQETKNLNFSIIPLLGVCISSILANNFDILIDPRAIRDKKELMAQWRIASNMFGARMERLPLPDFDGLWLRFSFD